MRRPRAIRLIAFVVGLFSASAAGADSARAQLSVEFRADGKCAVTAGGEGLHAEMTYTPPAASRESGEFRCAVPPLPGGRAVDVQVLLAPGARPAGAGIPALSWTGQGGPRLGTGPLDALTGLIVVPGLFQAPA